MWGGQQLRLTSLSLFTASNGVQAEGTSNNQGADQATSEPVNKRLCREEDAEVQLARYQTLLLEKEAQLEAARRLQNQQAPPAPPVSSVESAAVVTSTASASAGFNNAFSTWPQGLPPVYPGYGAAGPTFPPWTPMGYHPSPVVGGYPFWGIPPVTDQAPAPLPSQPRQGPSMEQAVIEEEKELKARIVEDSSYEERLEMVGDILNIDIPSSNKPGKNFALSVGQGKDGEVIRKLPASGGFQERLDSFLNELTAGEGSKRSQNQRNRDAFPVGKYPPRQKPKMGFYEIADRPWLAEAARHQKGLYNTSLYRSKAQPPYSVTGEQLMDWETMGRENLSILSHVDHFVAAGSRLFELLHDLIERGEELDREMLWNLSRQGICMMHSSGMAVQDLVKGASHLVGETLVTRRDAWLKDMKPNLSEEHLEKLRFSSLNCEQLFEEEVLAEAKEAASKKKEDASQAKMLSAMTNVAKSVSSNPSPHKKLPLSSFTKGKQGQQGGKPPFQGRAPQEEGQRRDYQGGSHQGGKGRFNKSKLSKFQSRK